MKVLFLTRSLGYGGAERQLVALAEGLSARGHRVTVMMLYHEAPLLEGRRRGAVLYEGLGKRGRWDWPRPIWRAVKTVRQIRPDIVHTYLVDANVWGTLVLQFAPGPKLVWGIRASRLDFEKYPPIVHTMFRLSARLARRADLIIANSEGGARDHIAAGYPAMALRVIPNGIDMSRFCPDGKARAKARAQWEVEQDAIVIGLVGRLDPMKGHATFLDAARLFAASQPDARFVCVGDGPREYLQQLRESPAARMLGSRVRFVPATQEVENVYRGLDLLTSASSFGEGFPNVVGEAMACGITCVVTDVGDSGQVVGDTGIVVPPDDARAMAEGWKRGLALARAPERPDPRSRIERDYSLRRLVDRTEQILQGLLSVSPSCSRV